MKYFESSDTLKAIVDKYPETIPVFTSNGFSQMGDAEKRDKFASSISLKMALTLKQLNYDTFERLLVEAIESNNSTVDATIATSSKKRNKQSLSIMGALPCPVRIPLLEKMITFTEDFEASSTYVLNTELKAASMGVDWIEENIKEISDPEKLPDLFISAGFDMFFDKDKFGKFKAVGVFEDFSGLDTYNESFADIELKDPRGHLSMIGVVPAVFLINTKELGDLPMPTKWSDLMKAEFENRVSLPVGDFDLFNGILLNFYKNYGDEGVRKLGRSLLESMHPSQMVRSDRKSTNRPIITIMPYLFTKMTKHGGPMQAIWPEDGAIISPIFLLSKKSKQNELQEVVNFFASEEVGKVLSHNGLFPTTNPNVDNRIAKANKFMWLGWDYIYSHDLTETIHHCEELFNNSLKGE